MKKLAFLVPAILLTALGPAEAALLVHGHRGTRGTRPENTLPAFEEALRAGVDVLELDLGVTKDGVVVISHEPGVNPAICLDPEGKKLDKLVPFNSLTLEEVKKYDCGAVQNPRFPRQVPVPGTAIPTLDEVFSLVEKSTHPGAAAVEFNIETKIFPFDPKASPYPAVFAKLVADVVKQHGMEKRVILQSFDVRTLREMKKLAPEIRTAQLTYEELVDIVAALKGSKTDIWSPNYEWITIESIKEAHAAGIPVAPWTLNTPEAWEAAIAAGVDAIITDYPADLIDYLKANKLR
ncbi:MAG: hypothetical protein A2016_03650 [Elusimicrobia bacterium GWF2_62_30]|nr:MAG: hypothetical protein A2016_03650 [Elusimicrobia bacterium GWF2_62_30]